MLIREMVMSWAARVPKSTIARNFFMSRDVPDDRLDYFINIHPIPVPIQSLMQAANLAYSRT